MNSNLVAILIILAVLYFDIGSACSGSTFTCTTPASPNQDRRSDKTRLSIATFNAEWLFWSNGNGGPSRLCPRDHSAGTCPWRNKAQADAHLKVVADFLVTVNADIIALEEVQDCRVLQCLIDAMGDNSYRPYLIPGTDTATDQNVGIITRVDPSTALFRDESRATILRTESNCGSLPNPSYESGVSKHFIARFTIANLGQISMIGAHLLAYPTTPDRCIRREAQATVIRNMAQRERNLGRQVVILGDINDYDRDFLDASDSVPTSRVSNLLKYDSGTKIMYSVVERITTKSRRYSSWWDQNNDCKVQAGELTLIDHLLISPALNNRVSSVQLFNTVIEGCDTLHSDHYPIKVTITTTAEEGDIEGPTVGDLDEQSIVDDLLNDEESPAPENNSWVTAVAVVSFVVVGILIGIAIFVYIRRRQNSVPLTYGTFQNE